MHHHNRNSRAATLGYAPAEPRGSGARGAQAKGAEAPQHTRRTHLGLDFCVDAIPVRASGRSWHGAVLPGCVGCSPVVCGVRTSALPLARLGANVEIQISEDQRAFEEVCGVEINRLVPVSGKKKYIPTGGSQGR